LRAEITGQSTESLPIAQEDVAEDKSL